VAIGRGVRIPATFERAAEFARDIEAAFAALPEPRVPCHNDLLHANFIADDHRMWLIDWEYAGMNDRYFDLGNLATNNEFDAAAEEALLELYFGSPTPHRAARLALMKVMSDFREAMWGVVQQAISTLDFDYVAYAATHFDRLMRHASRPQFRQALAAAASR
jgi:thiamine kinase-like enzyme